MTKRSLDDELKDILNPTPAEMAEARAAADRDKRHNIKFMIVASVVAIIGLFAGYYYM